MEDKTFFRLEKYHKIFHCAIYDNYMRVLSHSMTVEAQELYKEVFKSNKYDRLACSNCTYNMFVELGKRYFKELKDRDKPKQVVYNETVYTLLPEVKVKSIKKKKNASSKRTSN